MLKKISNGVKLFGTDGIRALVNEENMGPEMGVKMGKALVAYCEKRKLPAKIVIGRDTRESGEMLENAVVSGILSMGGEATLAGVIPTPGLACLVRETKAGSGIVISASHNPFFHNGLKPFNSDGTKFTDEQEAEVQEYIVQGNAKKVGLDYVSGKKTVIADGMERYINFLLKQIPEIKPGRMSVVLDCANGATFQAAPLVFGKVAKKVDTFFASPDGRNINENCGSQHTETLGEEVKKKKADLGLAFDGDGDRLIVVDEKGNTLTGDQVIYVIAKMMHEKGTLKNETVVTTVMSNLGFVKDLENLGIKHLATAVGDRPVFFEMTKRGAVLGGEESGHIIMTDVQPTGDGIASGLMLMSALDHFQKPLSELAKEVTLFPKILVNAEVRSKPDLVGIPGIAEAIKKAEEKLGDDGRVVVRYSGTENLARVMVEGRDEDEITALANGIKDIIADKLN